MFFLWILWQVSATSAITSMKTKDRTEIFNWNSDAVHTLSWIVKFTDYVENRTVDFNLLSEIPILVSYGKIVNNHHLFAYKLPPEENSVHLTRKQLLKLSYRHFSNEGVNFVKIKEQITRRLDELPEVEWYSQQVLRRRFKRGVFDDPYFQKQWYLYQKGDKNLHLNVTSVWKLGITGRGITSCVLDDGLEWTNEDIRPNFEMDGSYNLEGHNTNPSPSDYTSDNHHGTRCAGEIAAAGNNGFCGVGVAPHSRVSAVRILDGKVTDHMEAFSLSYAPQINYIYSCSWGPADDGIAIDGPHHVTQAALVDGIKNGRHGYGSIFVVASGNGGQSNDDCNYDGYANSPYTITIGAVDSRGQNPYYVEHCASVMVVTFGGGAPQESIVTTDWYRYGGHGCTESFEGTSAAAPLATGILALMLEARPCLTWRDVQYILALTAVPFNGTRIYNSDEVAPNYVTNGAKLRRNGYHGFGLMNAWRAVQLSRVWPLVPPMMIAKMHKKIVWKTIEKWPRQLTATQTVNRSSTELTTIEHVLVTLSYEHAKRGDLEFFLTSPAGTPVKLAGLRKFDRNSGSVLWTFTALQFFGESPIGSWHLQIGDRGKSKPNGRLHGWRLEFTGTNMTRGEFEDRRRLAIDIAEGRIQVSHSIKCPLIRKPVTTQTMVKMSIGITVAFIILFVLMMVVGVKRWALYGMNREDGSELLEVNRPLLELESGSQTR